MGAKEVVSLVVRWVVRWDDSRAVWRASSSVEQMVYDLAGARGRMMVDGMVASSAVPSAGYSGYATDC